MHRSFATFAAIALLGFAGIPWLRGVRGNAEGRLDAPAEATSMLLEVAAPPLAKGTSEPELVSPPEYGLCEVHNAALVPEVSNAAFEATVDTAANVRARKFPRARLRLIAARVITYDRPIPICGGVVWPQPRTLICRDCEAAQKQWFQEHPAPPQVRVHVPGAEPLPF